MKIYRLVFLKRTDKITGSLITIRQCFLIVYTRILTTYGPKTHFTGRSRWHQINLRTSHTKRYLLQYRKLRIEHHWEYYLLRRLSTVCRDVKAVGPCGQHTSPSQAESALLALIQTARGQCQKINVLILCTSLSAAEKIADYIPSPSDLLGILIIGPTANGKFYLNCSLYSRNTKSVQGTHNISEHSAVVSIKMRCLKMALWGRNM
jgi:hypothetical protein